MLLKILNAMLYLPKGFIDIFLTLNVPSIRRKNNFSFFLKRNLVT